MYILTDRCLSKKDSTEDDSSHDDVLALFILLLTNSKLMHLHSLIRDLAVDTHKNMELEEALDKEPFFLSHLKFMTLARGSS